MKLPFNMRFLALVLVVVSLGCQEFRPASPTAASLFVTSVEGVWTGPMTRIQSFGGECAGEVIETFLPTNDLSTVSLGQDGTSLLATMTTESTGLACRYSGTATGTAIALNATSCDRTGLIVECATGERRELRLVGSSITGSRAGFVFSGNVASTYNVFDLDGNGRGALVAGHTFSVTRR